ncbi:MAG: TonB family protein, partial [bacterium]|nr:TonB family protein [bacterium]
AIVIWEETIGETQPKVAAILHQLATVHERQRTFSAAGPLRLRRIEILKKSVGDTHPRVAMAWGRLAGLYTRQSRLDDADKAYRAAFEILDHGTGPPHPALSRALRSYVVFLKKSGRHGEAVEFDAALRQLQGAVYRLGGGVTPPKLIEKREPESSEEARKLRIDGTVVMSVVIDEQGVPTAITVVAPAGFGMDEKAVEAVSAWRFQPAEKDGKPVAAVASIEVNFRIL